MSRLPRGAATAALLLSSCCAIAADSPSFAAPPPGARVVYTSPVADARDVRPQESLVFRFDRELAPSEGAVALTVTGSLSGRHAGSGRLADDGRTFVFRPVAPFAWGERVRVALDAPAAAAGERRTLEFTVAPRRAPSRAAWTGVGDDPASPPTAAGPPVAADPLANLAVAAPPPLSPTLYGTPAPGKLFLGMYSWSPSVTPYMMILENSGAPVFYRQGATTDFKLQPDGLITYFDLGAKRFYALDTTFAVVDSFQCGNGYETDAHELILLPDGHALLLGLDTLIVDMSVIVPGGYPEVTVIGAVIQEIDATKQVVFQWRSWDHFEITDATHENLNAAYIDYVHANALDVDADGSLLLSSRHMDEITKIDRETGAIVWRWGGKHNQFTFVGDTLQFSHQHAIRRLENGHYMLFDNGNFHDPPFSRAVEYALDADAKTAENVWQYRHVPDIYATAMGNAQRLPNGNTLIGWGTGTPDVTEVSGDGDLVMVLPLPGTYVTYRVFRQPWPPQATAAAGGSPATRLSASLRNPFRSVSDLFLGLPAAGPVTVRVFDTQGRLVRRVLEGAPCGAGVYRIRVDLAGVASGVYFCRVETAAGALTRRLVKLQ